jgi:hypothetical protein
MDDTSVIWPRRLNMLKDLLHYLNNVRQNIQLRVKMERDGHLPFLDRYLQETCWLFGK